MGNLTFGKVGQVARLSYFSDSKIFSAAARGFSAAQIGRPITSQLAPAAMRFTRTERAFLVVGLFRAGANAGRHELNVRGQNFPQGGDFQRRTNQPAQTRLHR